MSKFQQQSHQLAAHIRNPEQVPAPSDIEERRIKIYRELFYNNIEGFASSAFPVLRALISDHDWHALVRDFMIHYRCHSPYFLEISQEFLNYLQQRKPQSSDLPFMLELAHYEWVELALDVSDEKVVDCNINGDLLEQRPVVSGLAWSLAYQYPVHRIGLEFQPTSPSEQPHYLIVYRDRHDCVGFMETNAVTARLLALLNDDDSQLSGRQVLLLLAQEMQHPDPEQMIEFGHGLLKQLLALDIILGVSPPIAV